MKSVILLSTLALVSIPALATDPQPAAAPSLHFTSIPIMDKVGNGQHKIFPYRNEDRLVVVVEDPIICGQKPTNAKFEIKGSQVVLKYDLTKAPASPVSGTCTAHSTFDIADVPHAELTVRFAGGKEPFAVAEMARCPNTTPVVDIYDCMVPRK